MYDMQITLYDANFYFLFFFKLVLCIKELGPFGYTSLLVSLRPSLLSLCVKNILVLDCYLLLNFLDTLI